MEQLTLDLGVQPGSSLANYWAGPNQAAVAHISEWLGSGGSAEVARRAPVPAPIYLWGEHGSGKTHLLESVRATLAERGAAVGWLDPAVGEPPSFDERWTALLLDDVQRFNAMQQHAAFNWFINAQTHRCAVLAAGALPAADLPVREDLRTRLGWGLVFQLRVLDEPERRAVLRRRAYERGVMLNDEVLDFMLTRFSRDLASLVELLDALDRFSLRTQRAVTVPLLKSMLEST